VNVYATVNGDLVDTKKVTHENISNRELFVTAAFQDDTIDSVINVTSRDGYYNGKILESDDHQCLLMMTNSHFRLFNKSTSKHRDIANNRSLAERYTSTHHWFDKDRGLVFCIRHDSLRVVRVTL